MLGLDHTLPNSEYSDVLETCAIATSIFGALKHVVSRLPLSWGWLSNSISFTCDNSHSTYFEEVRNLRIVDAYLRQQKKVASQFATVQNVITRCEIQTDDLWHLL